MYSCSIPYLQKYKDKTNLSDDTIKHLEEIDIDIKSELASSGLFTTITKKATDGSLIKLMVLTSDIKEEKQNEQIKFIQKINDKYKLDRTNFIPPIYYKTIPVNGEPVKNVVIVDVRVLENANLKDSDPKNLDEEALKLRASDFVDVLKDSLSPPFQSKITELDDFVTNEEQMKILNDILDSLSEKVKVFNSNFTDFGNAVKLQFNQSTYNNLNLLKYLSDKIKNDESIDKIADLSSLIMKANHTLNYIYRRFSGDGFIGIKDRIKNLNEIIDKDEFLNQQKYIGEFFGELREVQHIFNFFSDFYVKTNQDKTGWENRNLFKFERGAAELLSEAYPENSFKKNKEWLKDAFGGKYDVVLQRIKDKLSKEGKSIENLDEKLMKVYEESKFESKSILATLEESHQKMILLNRDSKELQKEYLATVIHKQIEEIYSPELKWQSDEKVSKYNSDVRIIKLIEKAGLSTRVLQMKGVEKTSDDFFTHFINTLKQREVPDNVISQINDIITKNKLDAKDSMYYADKEKIKSLLTLADKDIDITDRYFEYGTQYNDTILATAATLVTKRLMEGELENNLNLSEANKKLKEVGLSINDLKRKEWESKFQQEILYLEDEDKLEPPKDGDFFIEVDDIEKGKKIRYKARKGRALVVENNKAEFEIQQKALSNHLPTMVNRIYEFIETGNYNNAFTINYTDKLDFYYVNKQGEIVLKKQFDKMFTSESKIKETIKQRIWADFYSKNLKTIDGALDKLIKKTTEFDNIAHLLNKEEKGKNYFNKNTYERPFAEGKFIQSIEEGYITESDLKDYVYQDKKLLVKVKKEEDTYYTYVNFNEPNYGLQQGEEVVSIFKFLNELQVPVKQNPKWESLKIELEKDSNMKDYYEFLLNKYKSSNKNLGAEYIKHGLIQVPRSEDKSLKDKLLTLPAKATDFIEGFKYKELHTQPYMVLNEDGKPVRADENGRELEEGEPTVYKIKKFLSGEVNKRIKPTFTNPIPYDETEDDLFLALHLLDASSTAYNKKKELEPVMLTLQTFFKGDKAIGIEERKAKVELFNKTFLFGSNKKPDIAPAKESLGALVHFMNTFLYGLPGKDYNLGGFSVKQATDTLKATAAFQVLAGNHIASMGNLLTGQTNMFLLAQGKKNGLSEKIIWEADKEYWKNVLNGNFAKDSTKTVFEQSEISQLVWFFQAIAGEVVDLKGQIVPKSLGNRIFSYDNLFLTTSMAEHVNQVPLMLGILRGYKLPNGVSFREILVKKQEDQLFEIDWEKGGVSIDDIATQKRILTDVKGRIETANVSANGQYSKYSKSELQKDSLFSMGLVFGNWIYPSLKVRYGKGDIARLAGEFVEDGYQRQFIRSIFSRFNEALDEIAVGIKKDNSLKGYAKAILKKEGIGGLTYGFFEMIAKQAGFVADRVTFSNLSKNSEKFNEWLYGKSYEDQYEQKRIALIRASSELTFLVGATLIGLYLRALHDEDDEEVNEVIKALELFTARYINDTGQFLFASSPSSAIDYVARKVKDPFALTRQFDTNSGLLLQLFGWDVSLEEGINFNIDDRYAKSGAGYEKGDLKIEKKLMKSVFSPLYQLYRFADLDEQLNYTKLLNKNSANQTSADEEELEEYVKNKE